MSDELQTVPNDDKVSQEAIAKLLMQGDLSSLTMVQRAEFLYHFAVSQGLNPATKPFDLIVLNNKLTLYANRTAADQLRKIKGITSKRLYAGPLRLGETIREDVYMVEFEVADSTGRAEVHVGCVGIEGLKGEALSNAIMKCHTKALRRGTLSLGGLGFLDELEVESVQKLKEDAVGEGKPRRVFPRPAAPAAPAVETIPQDDNSDMPIIEATIVPDPPKGHPSPPPAFPSVSKPLPAVKPPVRV